MLLSHLSSLQIILGVLGFGVVVLIYVKNVRSELK
jgi:hypothetical protein